MSKDSGKNVKINTTTEVPSGGVMESTLNGMEQWDMNVVNDTAGSHKDFNGPSKLSGK